MEGKLTDLIARIPLFQGLSRKQTEALAMILTDQVFKRGEGIFSEGDEGAGLYIVVSGRVKIFKVSMEGKEQILHIFGPGEPFGEVAVFTGRRFPAHAEALEESRAFFFPRREFIELIQKDPSLALNMLAVLSQRLHRFSTLVENLSLKEVPGRLAAYLLYLGEGKKTGEVTLDVSKNQLASVLGTIPETLSRILARMTKEGFIEARGPRNFQILDRSGLEELASGERRLA
ncbi:MAG TPA: Crp/Fnr family transcriptional regulator [Thermodesulfobacteriota bacterium]|nr:Crp/Fnr family transcriptional regulator [Thermodesulfobacteriota bacterium]